MIANFKNENRIIITGADRAEALLISQIVSETKAGNKDISLEEFYDIDGDVNGFAIDLKDKETDTESEIIEGE